MAKYDITVKLVGEDGNAFAILSRVWVALKDAGVPKVERDKFIREATSGSYEHLLAICADWVNVDADWVDVE